jgi:tetratricopeptide (TPR) repeat protein
MMLVCPAEAPFTAIRIGVANPFNMTTEIQSAVAFPSDSYSLCAAMQAARGRSNTTGLGPTGGASGSTLYWDNLGSDMPLLGRSGSKTGIVLPANPANQSNAVVPTSFYWSDRAPCLSLPRVDGGSWPLVFIYVTISSASMATGGNGNFVAFNNDRVANRGRHWYSAQAWHDNRGDYARNPTGTGWKFLEQANPVVAVEFTYATPGVQIVVLGDSLNSATGLDDYSSHLWRTAMDLSTPALPINVACLAYASQGSATYCEMLRMNLDAINPGILALQVITRNDGGNDRGMRQAIERQLAIAEVCKARFGTALLATAPGCEPSYEGDPGATAPFVAIRNEWLASAAAGGIPFIDGPSVIGDTDAPWNYITNPVVTTDGVHPNSVGIELTVPLARSALSSMLPRQVRQHKAAGGGSSIGRSIREGSAARSDYSVNFIKAWWERRQAFSELARIQRHEEDSAVLDDTNPLNRAVVSITVGDPAEALRCWRVARARFPNLVLTHPDSLKVLFGLNLFDEAEELMAEGQKRYPRDPYFAEGSARAAHRRGDVAEAVRQYVRIRNKFPGRPMAYTNGAAALRDLGRPEEAEQVLGRALTLFDNDIHCRIESAKTAEALGNWELALQRWTYVENEMHHVSGATGTVNALEKLGRSGEVLGYLQSKYDQYRSDKDFARVFDRARERRVQ